MRYEAGKNGLLTVLDVEFQHKLPPHHRHRRPGLSGHAARVRLPSPRQVQAGAAAAVLVVFASLQRPGFHHAGHCERRARAVDGARIKWAQDGVHRFRRRHVVGLDAGCSVG